MTEENQITKEPQQITKEPQQVMKEPQRVTTKNPKKIEAGKRLAEHNRKKREAKKREEQAKLERTGGNQYCRIGAAIALGVLGGLGFYIYQSKKVEQPSSSLRQNKPHPQAIAAQPQINKFEMD